jgi:coproporphyrinogen III oxidase-like Fe-S oxidoreductase
MVKKKKIREEFERIFKSGNEKEIKKMLEKNSWLLDEMTSEMDEKMGIQDQVIAALGVMEDELARSVPIDEISFCLKVDFNIDESEEQIREVLFNVEKLGLVKKDANGWRLTNEGGKICDNFLNKLLSKSEI